MPITPIQQHFVTAVFERMWATVTHLTPSLPKLDMRKIMITSDSCAGSCAGEVGRAEEIGLRGVSELVNDHAGDAGEA